MTKRFAHIHKLVEIRGDVRAFPDNTDRILHIAIVRALPTQYHQVYDWIVSLDRSVYSAEAAQAWDLKQNHVSTILNELWQFGLLSREQYTDEHGKGYKYKIAD